MHREFINFSIVEAVLSRREIDRRVLTADFNERVGFTTCKKSLLGQSGHRTMPRCGVALGSDSLKDSAKMRYTSDLVWKSEKCGQK